MIFNKQKIAGFTLIEMIVSLAVFSIVVTTAVGAMLVLIATNQRLQAEQSVMTNLAFALDTMTREMRTGFGYYCNSRINYNAGGPNNIFETGNNHESLVGNSTADCSGGMPSNANLHGVSFYEGGDSITGATAGASRILYFFDRTAPDPDDWTIMRRVGNGTPQAIVSSGLYIEKADFIVTGSDTLVPSGDVIQPTITVYIEAREKNSTTDKIYRLQTTVTQRILDL